MLVKFFAMSVFASVVFASQTPALAQAPAPVSEPPPPSAPAVSPPADSTPPPPEKVEIATQKTAKADAPPVCRYLKIDGSMIRKRVCE